MIKLLQGDCLERMKEIPDGSVDMILTDPPYQITACKWDSIIPLEPMWEQLKRIIKPNGAIVMTASQPFTSTLVSSNLKMFRQSQVWDKKMPTGHLNAKKKIMSRHEDIVMFSTSKFGSFTYNPQMTKGKYRNKSPARKSDSHDDRIYSKINHSGDNFNDDYYPTTIIEISNANQKGKVHPTQKPVALMDYLIKTYTNEGEAVLDFAMGSGTTGVAAKNLNRNFIGIELDETYLNIAQKRITG
jgi:site-specific DNA-methyltransferase (adenine-specific)